MEKDNLGDLIKYLEGILQEIEENMEYYVDVEGVDLTDDQQNKIAEPLSFEILRLKTNRTSARLAAASPPKDESTGQK